MQEIEMSVTADDIAAKKFTTVRGIKAGYSLAEVDDFLEQTESSLRQLQQRVAELEEAKPSVSASHVLELAQQTADSLLADARSEADSLLQDARRRNEEATSTAAQQVEALNARIAELTMIERDYRSRLKDFVSSALNDIES
ncbi:MAG: DivIVA domain-containing protein [Actinobacteria bacterium]|nr:DivIVA domain-containing protein [Actinomycetota bacterium]